MSVEHFATSYIIILKTSVSKVLLFSKLMLSQKSIVKIVVTFLCPPIIQLLEASISLHCYCWFGLV